MLELIVWNVSLFKAIRQRRGYKKKEGRSFEVVEENIDEEKEENDERVETLV